ncbi:hypothetical protein [Micavibrio aeruginosavorus]|uniref:hypothetical protein n=1 Tax=Micavibrio aeruginosavorus TaxID=349221 RepID=UPI001F336487|nr:hypothetical protein [Micavibrio aeruginosavorus]
MRASIPSGAPNRVRRVDTDLEDGSEAPDIGGFVPPQSIQIKGFFSSQTAPKPDFLHRNKYTNKFSALCQKRWRQKSDWDKYCAAADRKTTNSTA